VDITSFFKRLYISDLDGTLLLPDKSLGQRTGRILQRFIDAGGRFTIATGRSAAAAQSILKNLYLPLDAITHNGALTINLQTNKISDMISMPGELTAQIFSHAIAHGLSPLAYALDDSGSTVIFHGTITNQPTQNYLDAIQTWHPAIIDDGRQLSRLPGLSLLILDQPQPIATLFADHCYGNSEVVAYLGSSVYTHGLGVGEIHAAGASKARAAEKLCIALGLMPQDIVAFGDNVNDLPLLLLAGQAFCPPDASTEVQERISHRIAPPAQEGVASYFEKTFSEAISRIETTHS